MLNEIKIIGRVGADPISTTFESGTIKTTFSVATSFKHVNKETGEEIEETDWHNIECWSGLAKVCSDYVKKGMLIYVSGRQKHTSYDDDGTQKFWSFVNAKEVKFLSPKEDNGNG